nr:zinc-binding dehydrogenase [Deltaproteobacteria bacterium]
AVGFDGRIVSVVEEPPGFYFDIWRADTSPFFAKSGTYHFVAASARARNGGPDDWAIYGDMMSDIVRLVEAGELKLPDITDLGSLSAETIREAHMLLETGKSKGKLALSVG